MSDSDITFDGEEQYFGRQLTIAETQGIENLVDKKIYNDEDTVFCRRFPENIRKFVSSIIQTSLYRVYEDGVIGQEAGDNKRFPLSSDQTNFEAYYLIDRALQNALSVSCPENENNWHAKAMLEEFPQIAPDIIWPSHGSFTQTLGVEKIEQYIKSWQLSICWLHIIQLYSPIEEDHCIKYKYRVQFSIPTRRTPVPRQTVSVYFTLVASKIKPRTHPIDVFYVVESLSLVHRPGVTFFSEEWLTRVLNYKMKLTEVITF